MYFLPRANPLYEDIATEKVVITDILEKLGRGGFTGYLSHAAPGFESYCIFAKGKLICVISNDDEKAKTGFEALALLFDKIISSGGKINVYRMTADLAMCSHALVVGTKIFDNAEVRQVDVKGMLLRLKNQALNGVVHFYTKERYAMIFYANGQPTGFYSDGAKAIETSPEASRQIAALPGACLSVYATKPLEELMHHDLLQMVNLGKLWEAATARNRVNVTETQPTAQTSAPAPAAVTETDDPKLRELIDDLVEVAMAYLSRIGGEIIHKRLAELGGAEVLYDTSKVDPFLAMVALDANEMDNQAKIDEMIDLMKSEIAGRLAV